MFLFLSLFYPLSHSLAFANHHSPSRARSCFSIFPLFFLFSSLPPLHSLPISSLSFSYFFRQLNAIALSLSLARPRLFYTYVRLYIPVRIYIYVILVILITIEAPRRASFSPFLPASKKRSKRLHSPFIGKYKSQPRVMRLSSCCR